MKYNKSGVLDLRKAESGNVALFSYDTKTLREDAQGLPQRSEGTFLIHLRFITICFSNLVSFILCIFKNIARLAS